MEIDKCELKDIKSEKIQQDKKYLTRNVLLNTLNLYEKFDVKKHCKEEGKTYSFVPIGLIGIFNDKWNEDEWYVITQDKKYFQVHKNLISIFSTNTRYNVESMVIGYNKKTKQWCIQGKYDYVTHGKDPIPEMNEILHHAKFHSYF